jgi:hypothetical protein
MYDDVGGAEGRLTRGFGVDRVAQHNKFCGKEG